MTEPLRDDETTCFDGFHSIECPGCGMTTEERDEGVTLTREPEPLECCQFACYEDPGCTCDGCVTREPGLLREAVRCWLAGDTKGLDGAMTDLAATVTAPAPRYTEDDPDWAAMVSPISERDGGHDDR